MNAATLDDINIIYEDAEVEKKKRLKRAHTKNVASKTIKVRSSVQEAKDDYKAAKKLHKASIALEKRKIKSYKILIQQARNSYRLIKLSK